MWVYVCIYVYASPGSVTHLLVQVPLSEWYHVTQHIRDYYLEQRRLMGSSYSTHITIDDIPPKLISSSNLNKFYFPVTYFLTIQTLWGFVQSTAVILPGRVGGYVCMGWGGVGVWGCGDGVGWGWDWVAIVCIVTGPSLLAEGTCILNIISLNFLTGGQFRRIYKLYEYMIYAKCERSQ